jgi:inorganic pyrophosphatase
MNSSNPIINLEALEAFDKKTNTCNVIIETPKGSRNKYGYLPELNIFKLKSVLPTGASFPFDFGFIPSTLGSDGDPIDVMVLMDEAAFPGCLISCNLIGVIEANQTENGNTVRNDRLIAISSTSRTHTDIKSIKDINKGLLKEIEHFFISYNQIRGNEFVPLGQNGPDRAVQLVKEGIENYKKERQ